MKKALITGITGQDGSILAEFLLNKNYEVHGIKRRTSLINTDRVDHLYEEPFKNDRKFILHHGDLTDSTSLIRIIQEVQPDGNPKKLLDCRLLNSLNWQPKINLKDGLMNTYRDFTKRVSNF